MTLRFWLIAALALFPFSGFARDDAGALAEDARQQLEAAAQQLSDAENARDRVRALTQTVEAYESGLEALRSGLRAVAIREDQLQQQMRAQNAEIARFLSVLQAIQPAELPQVFLHPDGPTGAARAAMVLSELTPALNVRAQALRQDVEDVQTLRLLQEQAAAQLQKGLTDVQDARAQLNQAMANRTDLPLRFIEDPVRTGLLIASSETLDAFSSGLSQITSEDIGWNPPDLEDRIGQLRLPARGVILRKSGEPDAAGVTRPGILLATRAGALVTTPAAATIRFVGPLLDLGNVVILELRPDTLLILAGLDVTYGAAGHILTEGTPVGVMGGTMLTSDTASLRDAEGAGTVRPETLYIEVREQNVPRDPLDWFGAGEDTK